MKLEVPQSFADVAVEFSGEEWKMLSKQQKELHRNVMVQNYENMVSVGYHIPVKHLLVYIKNDKTIPSAANDIAVQEMQLPDTSISINRSTDCTEVWSQQSSLGKCVDSDHVKALLERIVITGHSLMPSESKHHNRMESKDEFGKKIELEMHLEPQEGKESCRLNHSDNLMLHFSGLTDQLNHIGKGRMNMSAIHKQVYTGKKQYKYTKHDKGFTSKVKLAANNITHIRQKLFKCTSHEKRFTQKSRVEKHQYTHTGLKPYKCATCGKGFTRRGHIARHQYTHTGQKLYKCATCGKEFVWKCDMVRHQYTHTGLKPYKCDTCGKRFTQRSHIARHQHTHTGQKPYNCATCGKGFSRKANMVSHQYTHTGQKPYKCITCGKEFARKGGMVRHQYTHTGQKPYKCAVCGKGFTQKGNMKIHQCTRTRVLMER